MIYNAMMMMSHDLWEMSKSIMAEHSPRTTNNFSFNKRGSYWDMQPKYI